jgi:hypothetical protein
MYRSSSRRRHARRLESPEWLEDRNLLSAAIYTVDAVTDIGKGSGTAGDLRYVIDQADADPNPAGSLIQFDPTVFSTPRTITLSSPLDLTEAAGPVVIGGPGASLVTISGDHQAGVFSIAGGVTTTIEGLTIADGMAFAGGGIDNSGTLTLADSTLAGDSASLGGGIFNNGGTLTVFGSTLAGDWASVGGGILNNGGTVTLDGSTLASDSASGSGGGVYNAGQLRISGATLAGDSAYYGGAIDNAHGKLIVVDSTLAGDSAYYGGAIDLVFGPLTAVNDTVAYNTAASDGAGLYVQGGMATLDNTIVALNVREALGGTTPDDISQDGGAVSSASADNLIGTGGSNGLTGFADNQVAITSPGLGALGYYGGPTETIPLLPGSPAIGGGSGALAVDPTTGLPLEYDQRGAGFDRNTDGTVDIGAFQYLPAASDTVSATWGTAGTGPLQTAADGLRLLPAGRTTDLPWSGIQQLRITLGQPQVLTAADVTVDSAIGVNYGPVAISGSGTNYTITLAQPIDAADRVTLTIVDPGVSVFNRRIDVLPGDVNDDGVVDNQDVSAFRAQWLYGGRQYSLFDDIDGDGQLDVKDYMLIRAAVGTRLPAANAGPAAVTARNGPGSGAASTLVGAASQSAPSGQPVSQGAAASLPSSSLLGPVARGLGQGPGTNSKTAATNGMGPVGP